MNKFEKELLDYVNEIFKDEIRNNYIKLEICTPEYAKQQGYTNKGWAVGILKMRENLGDVRVVIHSPNSEIMDEVDDYHMILKKMVVQAKNILNNPPFEQYISQGVIRTTYGGEFVEFIPKDKLREMQ